LIEGGVAHNRSDRLTGGAGQAESKMAINGKKKNPGETQSKGEARTPGGAAILMN